MPDMDEHDMGDDEKVQRLEEMIEEFCAGLENTHSGPHYTMMADRD